MPAKELRFDTEARQALRKGADAVADAVSVTLGPRGRSVVLDKKFGPPLVTVDGVTVARDLEFKDHFENMGAQLLREVAVKTNDVAGDGTTTATVLSRSMIDEGLRLLGAGAFPVELRRGMLAAAEAVEKAVRERSHPVDTNEDIRRIATISAGDAEIGTMLADAFAKVGREGVVSVESADGIETTVEVVEGMQFDRGYVSPYLVTDQKEMVAELDKPAILITDAKVSAVKDLLPALELVVTEQTPLLLVAEDVTGEALATLVVNRMRGTLTAVAVKAPGFGDRRKAMLQDLAVLTGATVVSEEVGLRLDLVQARHLGGADRVTVTKDDTTVVGGAGERRTIEARCEEIRQQIEETDSDWDREKLQERLARLTGGVAVIKVGAPTEVAMKERKARVEDALHATRAALEDGYVAGGGVSLIRAREAVDRLGLEGDALAGAKVVRRALEEPLRVLAGNAGLEGAVAVNRVAELSGDQGLDVSAEQYGNLVERGIIDPTKVVVTALTSAASIATMIMTTEALVAEAPEREEHAEGGPGHSHGGGGGGFGGGMGGGMDDDEDMDF
ncbi:MAG TPA: chaperonin GroEL [Candidatus Binatia bacterium]|nr:chaperonin GroEL [Candidatus Binatia bacterium]